MRVAAFIFVFLSFAPGCMAADQMAVEPGEVTAIDRAEQWVKENPDLAIGIQGSLQNLGGIGSTPQQNVLEGAAEAVGAGVGEKLNNYFNADKQ